MRRSIVRIVMMIIISALFGLAGCGGGGSDNDGGDIAKSGTSKSIDTLDGTASSDTGGDFLSSSRFLTPRPNLPLTDLVVIGNSITSHDQLASIGWYGSWGMAASSADKDFAHLVAVSMNLPLTAASNFAALEQTPLTAFSNIPAMTASVKATTMAVIQLGDNVLPNSLPEFTPEYGKLLDAVKHAQILICTSTWWKDDTKDLMIKTACTEHGGRYVFIGDIQTDPANLDGQGEQFSHPGVNSHPHDWSMAMIADRIVSASLSTHATPATPAIPGTHTTPATPATPATPTRP